MSKIDIDIDKLKELFETTEYTNKQIADILGCSTSCIDDKVRLLKLKKYNKFSFLTKELIEDMYINQSLTMKEIADKLNVKKHNIQAAVERYELKRPSKYQISKETILSYIDKGYNTVAIAKELNCSEGVIRRRCIEYEINTVTRDEKTNGREEEIKKLYLEDKLSLENIGRIIGCSGTSIKYKLKKMGVYKPKFKSFYPKNDTITRKKDVDINELERLISEGKTYKEISNEMGITKTMARGLVKDIGLKFPKKLDNISYDELYKLYITEQKTTLEIGNIYNCSGVTISRKLEEYGIFRSERHRVISKEELEDLYINQNISIKKISKITSIPERIIKRNLKEYNIKKESKYKFITEDLLREMYLEKGMNVPEISEELEVSQSTISSRIHRHFLNMQRDPKMHKDSILRSYQYAHSEGRSAGEKELESLFPTIFLNTYRTIHQELDLLYPQHNLAIEYNGEYWHSDQSKGEEKKAKRHIMKMNLCEKKGIQLINIFERFWKNKTDKLNIINILKNKLCPEELLEVTGEVSNVDLAEQKVFENQNNINNYKKSDFCIGIYNNGSLLSSLSFKNLENNKYEIIRYTARNGYKEDYEGLLKYFIETYNPDSIIIKCDKRYYNGDIFRGLGFKFLCNEKVQYEYMRGDKVISRSTYKRHLDEYKNYYKVYDCGKVVLEYK